MGLWGLSCHRRRGRLEGKEGGRNGEIEIGYFGILELELSQEEGDEEGKEGGRKGEIEMGHLGYWSLSCYRMITE